MVSSLLEKPLSLVANWKQLRRLLDSYGPPSLVEFREQAIAKFEGKGFPTTKDEEFKYTPLRGLSETEFVPAYGATVSKADVRATVLGKIEGVTLGFVNGQYAPELSDVQGLPEGAYVLPFSEAFEADQDLLMTHLGKIATLENRLGTTNDERFVSLNDAHIHEGAFVYLPKNSTVEVPIHLVFVSQADHGSFAAYPRILIVAEENSEAKVIETYQGLGGTYFNNCVTEIFVGKNARLEHVIYQDETKTAHHIAGVYGHQEGGSTWTSTNVQFGSKVSRNDVNLYAGGEHTESRLNGVYLGQDDQIIDNHTRIDHAMPNCNSFEVYKGILDDRAVGVFNGKIFVYLDAQKTDAKQTNQALLLSGTASINTKPQLEIFADDVKCTHGATIGQLRDDALFYLRARGIPEAQARAVLIYAFAAEVLEQVSHKGVKNALEAALFAKLHRG